MKTLAPLKITPPQIESTIKQNTFRAQDAGMYSNEELD